MAPAALEGQGAGGVGGMRTAGSTCTSPTWLVGWPKGLSPSAPDALYLLGVIQAMTMKAIHAEFP